MEIFGIGLGELLLIAVAALIILGPDRLPEAARMLGKGIADFRRAIEPARNAWADVTKEINSAVQMPAQAVAKAAGNPWKVHPLAEGLSEEEREQFFATGALPTWRETEIAQKGIATPNGRSIPTDGLPELDYPMPHTSVAHQQASPFTEELFYPEPRHTKSEEEKTG